MDYDNSVITFKYERFRIKNVLVFKRVFSLT